MRIENEIEGVIIFSGKDYETIDYGFIGEEDSIEFIVKENLIEGKTITAFDCQLKLSEYYQKKTARTRRKYILEHSNYISEL
jgi:hypothetical protein